jgi:DnaK suppressor protein
MSARSDTRPDAVPARPSGQQRDCRDRAARVPFDAGSALREQRRFRLEQLTELSDIYARSTTPYGSIEVTANLRQAAVHALAEIDAALRRLDDGSYGCCTGCGQQIIRDRLEVLPAAALCMACQYQADRRQLPARLRIADPSRCGR